jgi:hypothetical protein
MAKTGPIATLLHSFTPIAPDTAFPVKNSDVRADVKRPLNLPWETEGVFCATGEGGWSMVKSTAGLLVFWGIVVGMSAAIGFLSLI